MKAHKSGIIFENLKINLNHRRILILLIYFWLISNVVSFIGVVTRIFYFPTSRNLIEHWSFLYNDKPWIPNNLNISPIFQGHFFGDFQLGLKYSSFDNPYAMKQLLPYGYPPEIHQIFYFLSKFDMKLIFIIYLLSILLIISWFIFKISKVMDQITKNSFRIASILIFGFSTPLIVGIDRGNFVVLAITLTVISLYFTVNDNSTGLKQKIISALLLSLAINLKAYVVVFIVILIVLKKWIEAALSISFVVIPNILLSLNYPGGPLGVLITYVDSLLYYSDNPDPYFSLSGNSVIAGIGRFMEVVMLIDPHPFILNINKFGILIGLIWLLCTLILIREKNLPNSIKISIALSNLQFFAPVSMFYTGLWSTFALLILTRELLEIQSDKNHKNVNSHKLIFLMVGIGAIITTTPNPTRLYYISTSIPWLIIMVLLIIRRIFMYYRKSRRKDQGYAFKYFDTNSKS